MSEKTGNVKKDTTTPIVNTLYDRIKLWIKTFVQEQAGKDILKWPMII
jgi:hypothetical protein